MSDSRIAENLEKLSRKHDLKIKIEMDGKELIEAEIKKKSKTVSVNVKDVWAAMKNIELVKLGLALKSMSSGRFKVKIRKGFFRKIFSKG